MIEPISKTDFEPSVRLSSPASPYHTMRLVPSASMTPSTMPTAPWSSTRDWIRAERSSSEGECCAAAVAGTGGARAQRINSPCHITVYLLDLFMTLGQLAVAIPAPPKWVLNANAVLQLAPAYSIQRARVFALTRLLEQAIGLPLKRAYQLAKETLRRPAEPASWRHESPNGVAAVVIDRERFLSDFTINLSRARAGYAERRRGRPPRRRRRGVAAARHHGVDISLLRESLKHSAADRLRRLDDDALFARSLKVRTS